MRLFHTSDWHLGQNLHGQERDFEHACFLNWLLAQLATRQPDVLLIAGDIFDTVNPPVKAQERLYDFIVSAHDQHPALTIVMIAGNHDYRHGFANGSANAQLHGCKNSAFCGG